jgi:E3 ubiquitin-protein ligase HERC1
VPLLIKTPNNRNNHGYNRECYCLNPASVTPTHRELFEFLGLFLGFSIRTKSAMNWHFPPVFWKQLLEQPVGLHDFDGLDTYSYQIIKDLEKHGAKLSAEEFDVAVMETFSTHLSDGSTADLVPNGQSVAVTHANHKEFLDKMLKCRLEETSKQMDWLRAGLAFVIDPQVLSFLSWEDVELRACGAKDIETEALKKISTYGVGEDHRVIKWFWEMFEEFTQEERRKYLKFVWGRSKIPSDTSTLRYKHQI